MIYIDIFILLKEIVYQNVFIKGSSLGFLRTVICQTAQSRKEEFSLPCLTLRPSSEQPTDGTKKSQKDPK